MTSNKKAQYRKALADDARFFMQELWKYHDLEQYAPLEPVDYDICHWLQNGPDRSVTLAFRGQGKTYKTNSYVGWEIYRAAHNDLNIFCLLVSASEQVAKQSLHLIRGWVRQTPWLQHMEPKKGTKERDGAKEVDFNGNTQKNPTIAALGITGQMEGRRANLIVPDDVETKETARTVDQRKLLRDRVSNFENIILAGGSIKYLMTPQHIETIASYLTKEMGYKARSWPARHPTIDERSKMLGLSPYLTNMVDSGEVKAGVPTCPLRFSNEELNARESRGRTNWFMQWQLYVGQGGSMMHPLKLSDLIVFPCNNEKAPSVIQWGTRHQNQSTALSDIPSVGLDDDCVYGPIYVDEKWLPYHTTKMYIDPSGAGADETAWAIISQLYGNLFLKRVGAYTGGSKSDNLDMICHDARKYRVQDIVIETNYGGDMMMQLLQPKLQQLFIKPGENGLYPNGWSCYITGEHATKAKESRIINTLEPVANQHRLIVDTEVAHDQILWEQFTQMSDVRGCLEHDDRVDALSGGVSLFKDSLDQDPCVNTEKYRKEEIERLCDEARTLNMIGNGENTSWIHL